MIASPFHNLVVAKSSSYFLHTDTRAGTVPMLHQQHILCFLFSRKISGDRFRLLESFHVAFNI